MTARTSSPPPRGRLGAGLVQIAPVPPRDPSRALLRDPRVPEGKRFCASCREPVGRGRDGGRGRDVGFCRRCGAPFSFEPKLAPGEVVAGQYEVIGCLAHGGMGWIYLARDHHVSDRWVVLKGLLNAGDSDATAAALAERQFLAEVEHPNIVKIFNFVEHAADGYIVMEFVGGRSLKQLLTARCEANGGKTDPLPPEEAIAYILEILPALGYLHDTGLVYCDFKPDNVIQTQHALKLIDLGSVCRLNEPDQAVFGTVGYRAPEIPTLGPSISSDLFTVARTLALLCIDFRGYQGPLKYSFPPPDAVPLFQRYDSLYRFLLTAAAPEPAARFQSAEEMADQLYGVLREVVANRERRAVPAASKLFTAPLRAGLERPSWRVLPRHQVSSDDASAGYLATLTSGEPEQLIAALQAAPEKTLEVDLRLATTLIETDDWARAEAVLTEVESAHPWDWRPRWYRGLAQLARGRAAEARASFTLVYEAVPGELAPKLALALASESDGDPSGAARWYAIVAITDPSITSASFGLARCLLATGDRAGALTAYERVPDSSSGYMDAQIARVRCLGAQNGSGGPVLEELLTAGAILDALPLEEAGRARLAADLLDAALRLTLAGGAVDDGRASLVGHRIVERDLRLGLEHAYRELARHAMSREERVRLVDQANRVRPRTWI